MSALNRCLGMLTAAAVKTAQMLAYVVTSRRKMWETCHAGKLLIQFSVWVHESRTGRSCNISQWNSIAFGLSKGVKLLRKLYTLWETWQLATGTFCSSCPKTGGIYEQLKISETDYQPFRKGILWLCLHPRIFFETLSTATGDARR